MRRWSRSMQSEREDSRARRSTGFSAMGLVRRSCIARDSSIQSESRARARVTVGHWQTSCQWHDTMRAMKLCRNETGWWVEEGGIYSPLADFSLDRWLGAEDPIGHLAHHLGAVKTSQRDLGAMVAPIQSQEVWAAGVTYLRSKSARMEESNFSAT